MTDTITIAQTGSVKEVDFKEGMTVGEALAAAEITLPEGMELRLNNAAHDDLDEVLNAGDQILIVGAIRGAN